MRWVLGVGGWGDGHEVVVVVVVVTCALGQLGTIGPVPWVGGGGTRR